MRTREARVDLLQGVLQAVLPGAHVVLAWVVGAFGEPDLQVAGAGGIHDVDALEVVVDGLAPDAVVFVGEGAELVVVVLERVGVDGAECDTKIRRVAAQRRVVVDLVPRDVQGNSGRQPRDAVDFGGVCDLLKGVARSAGSREHLEPGARVAERPRWQFDRLLLECVGMGKERRQICHGSCLSM